MQQTIAAAAAVAVVTFCVFIPTLQNALLEWDDAGYIYENHFIKDLSWDTVTTAFTTFYTNYWAPLTWLSLAIDYAVWGLNPVGYHLTNNLLHAMNAAMVFLLFLRLLRLYGSRARGEHDEPPRLARGDAALWTAALAALLFALHPLRVESVAWVSDRKDVLALFFGVPALLAYLRHAESSELNTSRPWHAFAFSPWYWLLVALYILSLLSKPLLVTVPLVLLVLDWYPLRRFGADRPAGLLLEKVPLFLCAGTVSIITTIANKPLFVSFEDFNALSRLLNAARSIVAYLRLTIWPADLSPFYLGPGNITTVGLEYGLPVLIVVAITISCAVLAKQRPVLVAAWAIYLVTLFPLLGFTQAGPQAMAARYTYLASLPLSLLAALGLAVLYDRFSLVRPVRSIIVGITVLLLLIACVFTWQQIAVWRNDVTLWTRVIELQPHTIGRAYFQRGYAFLAAGDYPKALADMNEALAIATRKQYRQMQDIYVVRARILAGLGDYQGAIGDYTSAIAADSSSNRARYYRERGALYQNLGALELAEKDYRSAELAGSSSDGR